MIPYEHKVQYYETDQMGVVHHSNYIRWFEEARVDFMNQFGFGYRIMEQEGIISPIISITSEYKMMTRFEETVLIQAAVDYYDGIKLTISYTVINKDSGQLCCTGTSQHCFLNKKGHLISLKKKYPFYDDLFHKMQACEK